MNYCIGDKVYYIDNISGHKVWCEIENINNEYGPVCLWGYWHESGCQPDWGYMFPEGVTLDERRKTRKPIKFKGFKI